MRCPFCGHDDSQVKDSRPTEDGAAFAFLTCEPNPLVAPIHAKAMPVILHPEDYDQWLDGEVSNACSLAQPFPSQLMRVE